MWLPGRIIYVCLNFHRFYLPAKRWCQIQGQLKLIKIHVLLKSGNFFRFALGTFSLFAMKFRGWKWKLLGILSSKIKVSRQDL